MLAYSSARRSSGVQSLDFFLDHFADIHRRLQVQLGQGPCEDPVLAHPGDISSFDQELHQAGSEQRLAFGLAVDQSGQLRIESIRSEAGIQIGCEMLPG